MPNNTVVSKERAHRQTNCSRWYKQYNVIISPDDIELYEFFKNNRKEILNLLPHQKMMEKLIPEVS